VAQYVIQNACQAFDVRVPSGVAQFDGLPPGESFKIGRELRSGWHGRAFDQHGNDPHVAGEGDADLETDEIVRIVQPPTAVPIRARQPLPADDRQQHVARTDGALEDVHEVDAGFDVGDVHEHRGPAEPGPQVVEEPAGMAGTVFTPIADEDAGRVASSPGESSAGLVCQSSRPLQSKSLTGSYARQGYTFPGFLASRDAWVYFVTPLSGDRAMAELQSPSTRRVA
jgi:hypothetical protein